MTTTTHYKIAVTSPGYTGTSEAITITVVDITLDADVTSICYGSNALLTANTTPVVLSDISYELFSDYNSTVTQSNNVFNVTPNVTDTFYVKATDNQSGYYTQSERITIIVNDRPEVFIRQDFTTFYTGLGYFFYTDFTGSRYKWYIDPSETLSDETSYTFTPTSEGYVTLFLEVTGANGCVGEISLLFNVESINNFTISYPPGPHYPSNNTIPVALNGYGGGAYSVARNGLTIDSSSGEINLDGASPGQYTIIYTYNDSNNSFPIITSFVVDPSPTNPVDFSYTILPTNNSVCYGNSITIAASASVGGLEYQWYSSSEGGSNYTQIEGATSLNYYESNMTTTKSYYIAVTTTGYEGQSVPIEITVNPLPTAKITPPSVTNYYVGETYTFTGDGAGTDGSYTWYLDGNLANTVSTDSTYTFTADSAKTITLTLKATSASGCTNSTIYMINISNPPAKGSQLLFTEDSLYNGEPISRLLGTNIGGFLVNSVKVYQATNLLVYSLLNNNEEDYKCRLVNGYQLVQQLPLGNTQPQVAKGDRNPVTLLENELYTGLVYELKLDTTSSFKLVNWGGVLVEIAGNPPYSNIYKIPINS